MVNTKAMGIFNRISGIMAQTPQRKTLIQLVPRRVGRVRYDLPRAPRGRSFPEGLFQAESAYRRMGKAHVFCCRHPWDSPRFEGWTFFGSGNSWGKETRQFPVLHAFFKKVSERSPAVIRELVTLGLVFPAFYLSHACFKLRIPPAKKIGRTGPPVRCFGRRDLRFGVQ